MAYTGPVETPETLTLTGLTNGNTYELQFWANDSRGGRGAWTITATDGNSVTVAPTDVNAGAGQFAIGTFVATGATEAITFVGNSGATTQVDAYQVRNLGVESVPEPSTVALMGLAGLAFLIVRRRHSLV